MNPERGAAAGGDDGSPPPKISRQVAAEAATWVARLHGPNRTRQLELACLAWQQESAAHRHAFERCTEVWLEIPNVPGVRERARSAPVRARPSRARLGVLAAVSAGVLLGAGALAGLGVQHWAGANAYSTAVGENKTVMLADGTRMSLNTATAVRVDHGAQQRLVLVDKGEASFDVAKDAARPFVVRAAGTDVVALGTVFSVLLKPPTNGETAALTVTLVEGQVAVRPVQDGDSRDNLAPAQPIAMRAGDRLRLLKPANAATTAPALPTVDRPKLDEAMAWQQNKAVFDNAAIADAVAEMNRYSQTPVVLMGDVADGSLRVSGTFRTGDNLGFATALAALNGLVVRERTGQLELHRAH